jgi:hypothetical protein
MCHFYLTDIYYQTEVVCPVFSWQNFPASPAVNSVAEKKIQPTKFDFLRAFGRKKILFFLWQRALEKYDISLICAEFEKNKRIKTNFSEFWPLFYPFCTKTAKIRPQLSPAALLFIRPF